MEKRFLTDQFHDTCFHAVDFFEERRDGYRRQELSIAKNFSSAVKAMIELFKYLDFQAESYYVDLKELRTLMHIKQPPEIVKKEADAKKHSEAYKTAIKEYKEHIKLMAGNKENMALTLTLNKAFALHSQIMSEIVTEDDQIKVNGSVNFESLSTQDTRLLEVFHQYKDEQYIHGKNVTGVNFHTKSSLDSGIELADLISYIGFQTLRSQHRIYTEMETLSKNRQKYITQLRDVMRERLMVNITDVTGDYKKIMKKASDKS